MNDLIQCNDKIVVFSEDDMHIAFHKGSGKFMEIGKEYRDRLDEPQVINEICEKFNQFSEKEKAVGAKHARLGRLTLLTTQGCNLRCKYCFAISGTYGQKKEVNMSSKVMKDAFIYMLGKYEKGIDLVHFFGGEPMLTFRSIKEFVPWCLDYCRERQIVPPAFSIVTNGTIMNQEIYEFCNQYMINFIVSIDGNKELNDLTRVSPVYESVYDVICNNYIPIKNRKFKIGCEMTLNRNHVIRYKKGMIAEWLDDIEKIGFDYAIVGCAETDEPECKLTEEDKKIFFEMERESIDYFFQRFVKEKKFLSVEIIGMIRQMNLHTTAMPCGAGYHSLTVVPSGAISPCYQFYQDENYGMGSIYQEDTEKFDTISAMFMDHEKYKPDSCKKCWLEGSCSVLCKGFAYNEKGSIDQICESRCWIFEAAYRRIMKNLIQLSKNQNDYKSFVKNVQEFSKQYLYNK